MITNDSAAWFFTTSPVRAPFAAVPVTFALSQG